MIKKQLFIFMQYIMPQHGLSRFGGWVANLRCSRFKNYLIRWFIKRYNVNLNEALQSEARDYDCFNDFFIRKLKPELRPITNGQFDIASPADGTIAEIGHINKNQLLQAKGHYFDLISLLGGDENLAQHFIDGDYATIYLAPHNYHRVHMPLDGKLLQTLYVPGKLFSVNATTTELIPNLYSRNERLICLFETAAGPMAVILVGAMIVGSMQMVWMQQPIRSHQLQSETFAGSFSFKKGDEIGHFKLGSTVLVLFGAKQVAWLSKLLPQTQIQFGESVGNYFQSNTQN